MFVTNAIFYTETPMSADELLEKIDLLLDVFYDEWHNIYNKCFELGHVNLPWHFEKLDNPQRLIQKMSSNTAEDRQQFLQYAQPLFDKVVEKLAKNSITMKIQQEDNVTDIIGVEEYLD